MTGTYMFGVLVLVGTTEPADPTFPSTNNSSTFTLSLKYFPTRPGRLLLLFVMEFGAEQKSSIGNSLGSIKKDSFLTSGLWPLLIESLHFKYSLFLISDHKRQAVF